jgi:hypothetical protein
MIYWNTVSELLKKTMLTLMQSDVLQQHRLVGGTALSLQLGHRMSEDIDLFTDAPYGSISYANIEKYLTHAFPYVSGDFGDDPAFGKSYLVGDDQYHVVKLDIYYSSEPFFDGLVEEDGVRMASVAEIVAMKVDVVQRGGRKKDFWDLHELTERFSITEMIALHARGFEWTHNQALIKQNFTNFVQADEDFDPICLRGKQWPFIKEDFEELTTRDDGA